MTFDRATRRKLWSHTMTVLAGLCALVALIPLASVVFQAATLGGPVLSISFLTQNPPLPCTPQPGIPCATGGVGSAIQGTLILVGLATAISVPVGLGAAIYAVEFRSRFLGLAISFTADVLTGVPSIIAGVFIYAYFVIYDPSIVFSTITGALALSVIMIPIVTRTCEEALRTVPHAVREAALALGISRWRTTLQIVVTTALPAIVTGILLSVMRASGEAAPLLFTAFGSRLGFQGFNNPINALPLLIYNFAESPYHNWIDLAWGAALILIILILITSVISRLVVQRMVHRMQGG
ncbi:MAG TPA: phosphate ABC transporter permease PstA [Thermoplasmata archaeon]|nr:phosphate ABC transporter permease PstA [Thermoplasmata archaeon]